ncbi:hypothetical protein D5086_011904 [Populus alba]|uniref:Uncharacterized protein n=1 Tax=Populus alba TaxID=43335 RepID=A0ACC4C1D4_POPAL
MLQENLGSLLMFFSLLVLPFLGLMFYLSDREEYGQPKFRSTDPDYIIPFYANPVPYRVLPLLHNDKGYETFAYHGRKFKDANGIII